ncbi:MAG: hypothetical protein Q4D78_03970 [Neisseria zoodegmatis]|uniref:hypothetical protein n=1 Tax=Neisseria zoodegmatis TaxID=326523 RepID=UPI0026F25727|nr:hypothetical protein [Neisseria zoodegmatis]MDO5069343.1 hypothetical protein [Neisseria zoodegmatis]
MKILYKINFLHFIFFPQFVFATSTAILPDGIARVTIKNSMPCVYLSNGKEIARITLDGAQRGSIDKHFLAQKGDSLNQCVNYNKSVNELKYDMPYYIYINENLNESLRSSHLIKFCISRNNDILQLVQINDNAMETKCSTENWKPQKYYGGLFGWLEKLKDSIFNKDIIEYK